jgi:hypothetical protein
VCPATGIMCKEGKKENLPLFIFENSNDPAK